MSRCYFITGTDTDCGKTTVTVALARRLAETGRRVACFKPVASGCQWQDGGWRNDDALKLMDAASEKMDYDTVNPIALEEAIAPHLAAQRAGSEIDIETLSTPILRSSADFSLVEGAGGWMVPLSEKTMTADLVKRLEADVILVVGMRLGCINHALLSARAIAADGLNLAGWIANRLNPDQPVQDDNIRTITDFLGPPLAEFSLKNGLVHNEGLDHL